MPPWNPISGHLAFCYKITSSLPKDAHPNYLPDMIRRELPDLGPIYYLDTWPFGPQMLIVASTRGLHQITQEHSLRKYPALKDFLRPIAEGLDLVTMEGDLWKTWRGVFNPGFSANYIASLTQGIIEKTEEFCGTLEDLSRSHQLFHMKLLTDNLTMDIIGRIVIYVTRRLDARFAELQSEGHNHSDANKSIIDLVLTAYLSEKASKEVQDMDAQFKKFTMNQIKLFLFSGHDTTSSTVCYIFYVLATNPAILARVCAEHTLVIGSDAFEAASIIASDPSLLNRIPYTVAVIKEVLRMYPAVSGLRAGEPNFSVTDDANRRFPTDDFLVWDDPQAIHRDPAYWPRPSEFLPERWLVAAGDPLHPIKGVFRTVREIASGKNSR
ncbi:hypothetical protein MMC22_008652 [Lobaria immixta]|nr:hypothetical protein [Lobaria immixta]